MPSICMECSFILPRGRRWEPLPIFSYLIFITASFCHTRLPWVLWLSQFSHKCWFSGDHLSTFPFLLVVSTSRVHSAGWQLIFSYTADNITVGLPLVNAKFSGHAVPQGRKACPQGGHRKSDERERIVTSVFSRRQILHQPLRRPPDSPFSEIHPRGFIRAVRTTAKPFGCRAQTPFWTGFVTGNRLHQPTTCQASPPPLEIGTTVQMLPNLSASLSHSTTTRVGGMSASNLPQKGSEAGSRPLYLIALAEKTSLMFSFYMPCVTRVSAGLPL